MCSHKNYDPRIIKARRISRAVLFYSRQITNLGQQTLIYFLLVLSTVLLLTQMERIETIVNFLIAYNFATTNRISILFSQYAPQKERKSTKRFLMICKEEMIILKQRSVGSTKNLRLQLRERSALQKLARQTS